MIWEKYTFSGSITCISLTIARSYISLFSWNVHNIIHFGQITSSFIWKCLYSSTTIPNDDDYKVLHCVPDCGLNTITIRNVIIGIIFHIFPISVSWVYIKDIVFQMPYKLNQHIDAFKIISYTNWCCLYSIALCLGFFLGGGLLPI